MLPAIPALKSFRHVSLSHVSVLSVQQNCPVFILFSPYDSVERLKTPTTPCCWQSIFCSSLCAQSTKVTCSNIPSWAKFFKRSRKYKRVRKNCLQLKSFRWDQSKQSHCNNTVTNMNCKASIKSCRVLLFFPGLCSQHVHNFSNFPLFFLLPDFPFTPFSTHPISFIIVI